MKLIRKGAEGDLFFTMWNGQESVLKSRKKKDYRDSSLDNRLRKQRTIRESEIMHEVKKFGIHVPLIYFVDIKNCNIIICLSFYFWNVNIFLSNILPRVVF